ncbi:MAG: hypothetical protein Q9178_006588 [Gyalolechia marmorata]
MSSKQANLPQECDREVIDLEMYDAYDTDVEELDIAPKAFTQRRQARFKQENSDSSSLRGGSSPPIKIEILEDDFPWVDMGNRTIDLTQSDREGNGQYESNTASNLQASIMDVDLGKTVLKRSKKAPINQAMMLEAQRRYAERLLKRPVGASSIFGHSRPVDASSVFADGGVLPRSLHGPGMHLDLDHDSDVETTRQFEKAKQEYEEKRLLGLNTFTDDVIWGKAKAAENIRRKCIQESESIDLSSDEAMESDAGIESDGAIESDAALFISQGKSPSKHIQPDIIDDSDQAEDVVDILGSEREARKAPNKRRIAKIRQRDQDDSRLAGIEEYLHNEKRKERKKAGKTTPGKRSKRAKVPKIPKGKSVKQPGFLSNMGLISSNVYDEANKNVTAGPALHISETRKDKALRQMLIDIPLEDLKQGRSDRKSLIESTKILGKYGRCHFAEDNKWVLKGMSTTLYSHQIQAAAWMKKRETGESEPLGGLLADQMGLGKTLMILACMVANRPLPTDSYGSKATLIVCTTSLVHQWEQELVKHTEVGVFSNVLRHCAGSRVGGIRPQNTLQHADVVITTQSYPKFKPPKHIVLPEKKRAWWDENYEKMRGILHEVHWYRVVLDEAQAIKNRDSQTSIGCRALMAKYRWAVSATPIQNHLGELYSFFKLLRVKYTGNYQTFVENFCNIKDQDCGPRLHAFLRQFMMRRTHSDTIMGRPLVVLPLNSQRTIVVELNPVERALYDTVRRRFVHAINQCGKNGILEKSYRHVLHMLLRLRQMTGHPFMLQGVIENLFEVEDIERLTALTEDTAYPSGDMLGAMKRMIRAKTNQGNHSPDIISDATPSTEDIVEDDFPIRAETSSPLIFGFRKYLQRLIQGEKWGEIKARSLCHKCGDVPENPHVTDCYHLYCYECLRAMQHNAAVAGEEGAACCACDKRFADARCCTGIAELETDAPASRASRPNTEKETMRWINYDGVVLPSTKTAAVQAQIEEWQYTEPDKKIIVFSQFHILLVPPGADEYMTTADMVRMSVLAKMFEQKEWRFVKYNGRMGHAEREKAINEFKQDPECRIMIASLKTGGVGLNLTMASKVICVDLWWNSSVEQQAFCRVFRIGQESETFITRFVAKNTVDEKLLEMQKRKEEEIGGAMDDEKMLQALSLEELMGLFGQVGVDEEGKGFIFVDDDGEFDKENPPTLI